MKAMKARLPIASCMRIATFAIAITLAGTVHAPAGRAQSIDVSPKAALGDAAQPLISPAQCRERLDARHLTFSFAPPVAEGDCAIPLPVKLRSLATGQDEIAFSAEPMLDCRLAERIADWLGNVVEPLARYHLGT